jgi:hypothetical protein
MLTRTFAVITSALIAATDVTGTWSATAESRFPSGKVETHSLVFVFVQTGSALTGSVGPDASHQLPIDRGRAANDSLTFDCKWGNGALLHFQLVVKGAELQGKAEGEASQVPADPGPNYTNTVYLSLKRADQR